MMPVFTCCLWFGLFLCFVPVPVKAVFAPKVISDDTKAYSFYRCSDDPKLGITLACSIPRFPNYGMYCADYCECPVGKKCYVSHRSYHQCVIDMPLIASQDPNQDPNQGGDWGRCLSPTPSFTVPTEAVMPTPTDMVSPTPVVRSRDHVCDPVFFNTSNGQRMAKFNTTFDISSGDKIRRVVVRFGDDSDDVLSLNYDSVNGTSVSGSQSIKVSMSAMITTNGDNKTVVFSVNFNDLSSWPNTVDGYELYVYAEDNEGKILTGGVGGWSLMGKRFKVWNCEVLVSGSVYDSSAESIVACPGSGYSIPVDVSAGFSGLLYKDISLYALGDRTMNVSTVFSYRSDRSNSLIFGQKYRPVFDPKLNGLDPVSSGRLKITDVSRGGLVLSPCPIATELEVSALLVDPYQLNPEIFIDFTTEVYRDSWFQVSGGGVASVTSIVNSIPVSCANAANCIPAVTINNLVGSNGLVSAISIDNDSGCGNFCRYGQSNNWGLLSNTVGEKYNYEYFYNNFFIKSGVGKLVQHGGEYSELGLDVGDTVVYIDGDLLVDKDIIVGSNAFFMVIASGKIVVDPGVKRMDGIFVSDSDFVSLGKSVNQLVINGVVYSVNGSVILARGYINRADNNTKPSVVINYRPDLIFSVPSPLTMALFNWREGR